MYGSDWYKVLALRQGFGPDTAHPSWPYNPACPSYGQCGAAVLACQMVEPAIVAYKGRVGRRTHYICKIDDQWFDITADQFGKEIELSETCPYPGEWKPVEIRDLKTIDRSRLIYTRSR